MRRLVCLALLAAACTAFLAPSAGAARCAVLLCPEQVTTANFRVHFNSYPDTNWRVNVIQAHEVATWAQRAHDAYVGWGFAAPLADGDGDGINIYLVDLPQASYEPWGRTVADNPVANTSSAHVEVDSVLGMDERKVAHLVFHVFQHSAWNPLDEWMREAGADWAAFRHLGYPSMLLSAGDEDPLPISSFFGKPDMPLDCPAEASSGVQCGDVFGEAVGHGQSDHPHWKFFTYLDERFGTASFVKDVVDRSVANGDPARPTLDFVSDALSARGVTLAQAFNDWSVVQMTGKYKAASLEGIATPTYASILTGSEAGAIPPLKVGVAHLSSRYLSFKRGDGTALGLCNAATLALNVTVPAGTGAQPSFYWRTGVPEVDAVSNAIPLVLQGTTASLSLPWDTCTWDRGEGLLALPNPSRTLNAQDFVVSGTLTVDPLTVVTPSAPPVGPYTGPTVPAPDFDDAPAIAVYGPELLRVSRKTRVLRLVVFASGVGKLEAKLGTSVLGTRALRTGNNDLRFTLPRTALRTLNARGTLTLTSLSPSGTVGATVKRNVTLTK